MILESGPHRARSPASALTGETLSSLGPAPREPGELLPVSDGEYLVEYTPLYRAAWQATAEYVAQIKRFTDAHGLPLVVVSVASPKDDLGSPRVEAGKPDRLMSELAAGLGIPYASIADDLVAEGYRKGSVASAAPCPRAGIVS